jgi:hypothetical protein
MHRRCLSRLLTAIFLTDVARRARRKSTVGIAPAGNPSGRFAFRGEGRRQRELQELGKTGDLARRKFRTRAIMSLDSHFFDGRPRVV